MADFLTRLAARALNRAPRVMPDLVSEMAGLRRPEPFREPEPWITSVAATGEQPSHESENLRPRATPLATRADGGVVDARPAGSAPRETMGVPARRDSHRDMPPLGRPPDAVVRRPAPAEERGPIVPASLRERTSGDVETFRDADRAVSTGSPFSAPDLDGGVASRSAARVAPLVPMPSTEPFGESRVASARPPRGEVASDSSSGTPDIAVPRLAAPPAPRPARSSPATDSTTSPSLSSPTTVRVTIGRIEVRSVPPPGDRSPARPSAPQRRTIALDAYLKQRNEGRS